MSTFVMGSPPNAGASVMAAAGAPIVAVISAMEVLASPLTVTHSLLEGYPKSQMDT